MDIQVQRLSNDDTPSFEGLYDIYSRSILASERKERAAIEKMLHDERYGLYVALDQGRVVGFSILCALEKRQILLLEYMAVDRELRSRGVGKTIFQRSVAAFRQANGAQVPLLIEVDADRPDAPDAEIRRKRIRFYQRLGCLALQGVPYEMPSINGAVAPQMTLFVEGEKRQNIPSADAARWIATIYREVYDRNANDPQLTKIVKSFSKRPLIHLAS